VWNNVIVLAAFISVVFMLLKLRQTRRSAELLPIYIYFLVFTTVSFILVVITNLLESAVQIAGSSGVLHSTANYVFFTLRSGPQWFVQIAVIVFMFQPDIEKKWVKRTIIISAVLTTIFIATTLVSSSVGDDHLGWIGLVRTLSHTPFPVKSIHMCN
jgi:hypothetical protein